MAEKTKKKTKEKILVLIIFLASIYLIVHFLAIIGFLVKYKFVDLRSLEPSTYVPVVEYGEGKEALQRSSFNVYYCHFNRFGSRNSFEVTGEERNLVVLLGDSFFFGLGLNDNETIGYFLNTFDQKRKYLNLAVNGNNIYDSVERYLSKCDEIQPPLMIVFQVLLCNDIYASMFLEDRIRREVENDYRFVWYPARMFIHKELLFRCYYKNITDKIYNDLTDRRFIQYVENPLKKLIKKVSSQGTKIMLIAYDNDSHKYLKHYPDMLKRFCSESNILFFEAGDLLESRYYRSRLPDGGHPSAFLNQEMAAKITEIIDKRGHTY